MRPGSRVFTIVFCILLLSVCAGPCRAESGDDASVDSPVLHAIGVEMGIALYSYAAAEAPRTVGWVFVCASPLYGVLKRQFSDEALNVGDYAYMGAIAALGLYNVAELSEESHSHSDRFWQNEAGWHLAFLALALGSRMSGDEEPAKQGLHTGLTLHEDGSPLFVMQYSF
jgi:hypothetical protein